MDTLSLLSGVRQLLSVTIIHETMSMGVCNRTRRWKFYDLDDLRPGFKAELYPGYELEFLDMDDRLFKFSLAGETPTTVDRYYQVLGTPSYGISNPMLSESVRFVLGFERDHELTPVPPLTGRQGVERVEELLSEMEDNSFGGKSWRNIALGREVLCILKDLTPLRDADMSPAYRMEVCERIFEDDLLDRSDCPRLCLSYREYWRVGDDYWKEGDGRTPLQQKWNRWWDDEIYRLCFFVSPDLTESFFGDLAGSYRLKFDFVQTRPWWEDNIALVEEEVERRLGGLPRSRGFCHARWEAKRRVLEQMGVQWRSPALMNPRIHFD